MHHSPYIQFCIQHSFFPSVEEDLVYLNKSIKFINIKERNFVIYSINNVSEFVKKNLRV